MPREDGFPTNEELLAAFSEIGRNIYVAALETTIEDGLPDAYKGKLLGHLILKFGRPVERPAIAVPHPVIYEELEIQPMEPYDAEYVRDYHPIWSGTKKADLVAAEVAFTTGVRLDDDNFIPSQIGTWGINTVYTVQMANTRRTRHFNTLTGSLDKMLLISGIALENAFLAPSSPTETIAVGWQMPFRPGMIFNGYESEKYLKYCLGKASSAYEHGNKMLADLEKIDSPEVVLTIQKRLMDEAKISLDSALEALAKRKR